MAELLTIRRTDMDATELSLVSKIESYDDMRLIAIKLMRKYSRRLKAYRYNKEKNNEREG